MAAIEQLITDNVDVWSSAVKSRSSAGRGSNKKINLYGIKKLRELILELAVRGLLVSQDPNDDPASELLKNITVEKDNKIKKQKVLPAISDEEKPFDLPIGWEWVRLGDIGFTQTGGTPKKVDAHHYGNSMPFIKPGDILGGQIVTYENDGLSQEGAESLGRIAPSDSVLMVCIGTIGKCARIDRPVSFNQQINSVSPYSKIGKYIVKVLQAIYFQRTAWESSSSTTIAILNKGKWEQIPVALAPEKEQHRIVAKVDELMTLCDQLEQQQEDSITSHKTLVETLLAALTNAANKGGFNQAWTRIAEHFDTLFTTEHSIDQLKQIILQLAVMGKLSVSEKTDTSVLVILENIKKERSELGVKKKEEELFEAEYLSIKSRIVENRIDLKARYFCEFITKGTTPSKNELLIEGEVPFLKVYNIVNNHLDFEYRPIFISKDIHQTKLKRSVIYPGDVIMNIVGPPLGKVAIITDKYFEWNMNQALAVFRPLGGIYNKYIYYMLTSESVLMDILGEVKGTAGQDNLSLEQCRNLVITIPSIEEQHRIVEKIDEIIVLCDALKTRINNAQTIQLHLADAVSEQAIN